MGKISCTLFIRPDGGVLVNFLRGYVEAINRNYEYGGPAETVSIGEYDSLEITYWRDADSWDTAVMDAKAQGFRDGWQAAMLYLGRVAECDSAYVSWLFNPANPERRVAAEEAEGSRPPSQH